MELKKQIEQLMDVDRVIAEKVMGYDLSQPGNWSQYSPSTNPAQFDGAFWKADLEIQERAIRLYFKDAPVPRLDGDDSRWEAVTYLIRCYQLGPLSDKAKALAEAALEVNHE